MKSEKTIFLHSMFRAGSTYMFNKFRSNERFWSYYEPLHHELIKLKKESLDIWKYDQKSTNVMNHPELNKPHFYEFKTAFKDKSEFLPFYDTDFAYREFFSVEKPNSLKLYIDNLIETAPEEKMPVLQFNRTSMRIDWFKANYPESFNIFLLRNPRDQFESYYQRGPLGKNVFLAINLYIILTDSNATEALLKQKINFTFTDDIGIDLDTCFKLSKKFNIEDHYKIFYYIWVSSYKHASEHADFILDMDRINVDQVYLESLKSKIHDYTDTDIDFEDYRIKTNSQISIQFKKILKVEKMVHNLLQYDSVFNTQIDTYLTKHSNKESTDNTGLIRALFIHLKYLFNAK